MDTDLNKAEPFCRYLSFFRIVMVLGFGERSTRNAENNQESRLKVRWDEMRRTFCIVQKVAGNPAEEMVQYMYMC